MGQVFNLPNPRERDWREMERAIRAIAAAAPSHAVVIDDLMPLLRQAFDDIFVEGVLPMPALDLTGLDAGQAQIVMERLAAQQEAFTVHARSIRTAAYIVLFQSVLQAASLRR